MHMKHISWQLLLGIALVALSAFVYFIHYLVFRDVHHIFIYLVGDIAFVFIEVLLVTLIIHRLLGEREKRVMLEKMNMVIGTFFSEVGTDLLTMFHNVDPQKETDNTKLQAIKEFGDSDFNTVVKTIRSFPYSVKPTKSDLVRLKEYLLSKRDFLLRLLENPNLLEHDSFTNLLWAIFHLCDELSHRHDIKSVSGKDYEHLTGDISRVYKILLSEWLDYMKSLKTSYPYLFSLAVRLNPFDAKARPEVG
jgi:hypothetical protein